MLAEDISEMYDSIDDKLKPLLITAISLWKEAFPGYSRLQRLLLKGW